MSKRIFIDCSINSELCIIATDGQEINYFDYSDDLTTNKKNSIYLGTVSRVEPSLQAAFIEFGSEKKAFLPYLISTPILFIVGALLVYYLIMPLAIKFFLGFETVASQNQIAIELEAKVNEYLSLIMRLIFAFGLSFQLPVVLSLLARVGLIDSIYLKKRRKYVIVIMFAFAALLTPPDPITQIGLALPLLLLYEISILTVKLIEKKQDA